MTTENLKKETVGRIIIEDIIGKRFDYAVLPEIEENNFEVPSIKVEIDDNNDSEIVADFIPSAIADSEKVDIEILIEKIDKNFSGTYFESYWSCGNSWSFHQEDVKIFMSEEINFDSVDELFDIMTIENHFTISKTQTENFTGFVGEVFCNESFNVTYATDYYCGTVNK